MSSSYVAFRRPDPSRPWGFRIQGGVDFGQPLVILSVTPNGLADKNGIRCGDRILKIGGDNTAYMTHQQAQQTIIRCGNEIDFELQRGAPMSMSTSLASPIHFNQSSPNTDYSSFTGSLSRPSKYGGSSHHGGKIIKSSTVVNITSAGGRKSQHSWSPESKPVYVPVKPVDTYKPQPSSNYISPSLKYALDNPHSNAISSGYNRNVSPNRPNYPTKFSPDDGDIKPLFDYMNMKTPKPSNGTFAPRPESSAPSTNFFAIQPTNKTKLASKLASAAAPKHTPKDGTHRTGRVNTSSSGMMNNIKPICHECQIDIRGPFLVALEYCFCPGHFNCKMCNTDLSNHEFVEQNGQFYCENDFGAYLAPKCAACGLSVVGTVITALEKKWHSSCFVCAHCRKPIGNDKFRVGEDSTILCEKHWEQLYQINCDKCHKPIEEIDRFLEAFGKTFHAQCFTCAACNCCLEGRPFHARDGKAFCKAHAHAVAIFS